MKTKLMQLADALAQAAFNDQMKQEGARAALEEEIDRVCKDAERYRFIRTRPEWLGWGEDFDPRDIDAIVDRAMQGEKS